MSTSNEIPREILDAFSFYIEWFIKCKNLLAKKLDVLSLTNKPADHKRIDDILSLIGYTVGYGILTIRQSEIIQMYRRYDYQTYDNIIEMINTDLDAIRQKRQEIIDVFKQSD